MECKFKNNNSKQKEGRQCQQAQNRNKQHLDLTGNFWSFHKNMCKKLKKNFKRKNFTKPYVRIMPKNAASHSTL